MIESLMQFDLTVFLAINKGSANAFFDWLMPILRNPYTWAPLYLFLLVFFIRNYKKRGAIMVLFYFLSFAATDFITASIIKPQVKRVRPCNEVALKEHIDIRVRCGSGYSFPSAHAANHFAMGVFLLVLFYRTWKPIIPLSLLWAVSIGYAQIYVGVHYPLDILGGGILGAIIGLLMAKLFFLFQPNQPAIAE